MTRQAGVGSKGLGIRAKILASPVIILIALIGVGLFTVGHFQSLDRQMNTVAADLAPDTAVATDLITALYRMRMSVQAYVSDRSPASVDSFDQGYASLTSLIERAQARVTDEGRKTMLADLEALVERYAETFRNDVVPEGQRINELVDEVLRERGAVIERELNGFRETAQYTGEQQLAVDVEAALRETYGVRMAAQRYLVEPTQANRDAVMGAMATLTSRLQSASEISDAEALRGARDAAAAYKSGFAELQQAMASMRAANTDALASLGPEIGDAARAFQDSIYGSLEDMSTQASDEAAWVVQVQIVIMVLAAVGGLAVALLMTRAVVRPVQQGRREIDALLADMQAGRADLSTRLSVSSRDEIGGFIGSVNQFMDTLQEVIEAISGATNRLTQSAGHLSQVTERTQHGAESQRSELEQMATAMNQMAASAEEIARNTADTASSAEQSTTATDRGRGVVNQTVDAIDALAVQVEQGAATVLKLQEESQAIGRVLDVIRAVAEQTNLLALNAAIEASRAGDAGRGFAVVAEEVRSLASRVQDSTKEIEQIIDRLQSGAEEAARTMGESQASARQTVERASEAGDALSIIAEGITRINDMATQIANAAEEQTTTAEGINRSVIKANEVVDQLTQDVNTVSQSSNELNQMSEELRNLVARFQA